MDLAKFMPARMADRLIFAQQFTGKHRPLLERMCACGCGETFKTTFPNKTTINAAHRKRLSRRKNDQDTD